MRPLTYLPTLLLSSAWTTLAETSTPNTGDQLQAFSFSFTTSTLILPITPSCPSPLTLTQGSPTNAGGPDPVAPYTMIMLIHEQLQDGAGVHYERIYSKSINVGSLSSLQTISHPLANGTQFIGCIWASNGVSGGCQDLMTVSESSQTALAYRNATSQCRGDTAGSWVTSPDKTLDVDIMGIAGTVAENGWPATCSDLRFTPKNGTAPFTLVIAPAFHPPVNITSNSTFASDNSMNYTIRLTHGQAFFAGVYDSDGNSWTIGPLHAGAAIDLSCLQAATGQNLVMPTKSSKSSITAGALAGGVVGAFIAGALGASLLVSLLYYKKNPDRRAATREDLDPYSNPQPILSTNDSIYLKTPTPYTASDSLPSSSNWPNQLPTTLYDPTATSNGSGTYDTQRAYRDLMGLGDFHPQPAGQTSFVESSLNHSRESGGSGNGQRDDGTWNSNGQVVTDGGGGIVSRGGKSVPQGMTLVGSVPTSPNSPGGEQRFEGHRDQNDINQPTRNPRPTSRNVYVVHSDGGGANVTIQLPEGMTRSSVVELPPTYIHSDHSPGLNRTESNHSPSWDDQLTLPFLDPPSSPGHNRVSSRNSGSIAFSDEELRARAEAARAEKQGSVSGSISGNLG